MSHDLQDQAEHELLELVRGEDYSQFTLTISRQEDGRWIVIIKDPTVEGKPGQGDGTSFAEAWQGIKSYWT